MKGLSLSFMLATAILAVSARAGAATITGDVSFGGGFTPVGGTGLGDATGIDITGDVASVSCALTTSCTGSYSSVTGAGVTATYNDFTFAPALGGSVTPLWQFAFGGNTYSFDLATIAIVTQTSTFLNLTGTGTLHITGATPYDDTVGYFSFTGTNSSPAVFAFSSTSTTTSPVPEPASMFLFGSGLVGVGAFVRRRLKKTQ